MVAAIARGADPVAESGAAAAPPRRPIAWWHQVLVLALLSVVYVYATGLLLGAGLLATRQGWGEGLPSQVTAAPADLTSLFVRWDGGYYLGIAERGYTPGGEERAFFPLYPITVGLLSQLSGLPATSVGMALSLLAFVGTGLLIYRWARLDHPHGLALLATALFFLSPMAFFYLAFYGEPLLILTSTAALYFARRGRFVESGLAIALAGAARPTAFLLAVPYLCEFVQQRDFSPRSLVRFVVGGCLAPLGVVVYGSYLYATTGLLPMSGGGSWKTYYAWPWQLFYDAVQAAFAGVGINDDWFSRAVVWHDLLYAVAAVGLSIWAFRRLRLSAALFLLLGVAFLASVHGPEGYAFWGISRRVAALVPVYPAVALLLARLPRPARLVALGLSVAFLGVLSAWFVSGRWVA